jgi:hypothetical protein
LVAAALLATTLASVTGSASSADFLPPLAPGQWSFAIADAEATPEPIWDPVPGGRRELLVDGRLARPDRWRGVGVFVRIQPASLGCARSWLADHGAAVQSQFFAHAGSMHAVDPLPPLPTSGPVRICAWVARSESARVRPVTQVIPLLTGLFGAMALEDGSYWTLGRPSFSFLAEGTAPFSTSETDVLCGTTVAGSANGEPAGEDGASGIWGEEVGSSGGCEGDSATYSFAGVAANLSFTFPEDASLAPGAANVHVGNACVFTDASFDTVAEAAAVVRSEGCKVGHVLAAPRERSDPLGMVEGLYIHGAQVRLVALGTAVDIVTNGVPPALRVPSPGGPGEGKLTEPEGGECGELAGLEPKFASAEGELVKLPALSSQSRGVAISAGATLGSVGICDRAISALVPGLSFTRPGLSLVAKYDLHKRRVKHSFSYSFIPLGWKVPNDTGASKPRTPRIDWPDALKFGGEAGPSASFTYTPGEPLEPSIDLVTVPVLQAPVTLISQGQPVLEAGIGPELSFGLSFDRKELAKQEDEDVAEGEDADTAAEQISEQVGDDVAGALEAEQSELAPASDFAASGVADESIDITDSVSTALDSELPTDATVAATTNELDTATLAADGLLDATADTGVDALVGDELIDVLAIAVIADHHHHAPPPDLVRHRGVIHSRLLRASPIRRLRVRALRRAPFPRHAIPRLVHERLGLPVAARVGRLAVSSTRLRAGRRLTVVAPFLGLASHAQLTLAGPGYRATRPLAVSHGTAGAVIVLPRHLRAGTWTVSVKDLAGVKLSPGSRTLSGTAIVRIGVFQVKRHRARR